MNYLPLFFIIKANCKILFKAISKIFSELAFDPSKLQSEGILQLAHKYEQILKNSETLENIISDFAV
jgi:hypothetical protein